MGRSVVNWAKSGVPAILRGARHTGRLECYSLSSLRYLGAISRVASSGLFWYCAGLNMSALVPEWFVQCSYSVWHAQGCVWCVWRALRDLEPTFSTKSPKIVRADGLAALA